MPRTIYQDFQPPAIGASWLNAVDTVLVTVLDEATTKDQARQALNVEDGAEVNPSGSEIVALINGHLGSSSWQSGGAGAPVWGTIIGDLSSQADLQAALDGKSASSHNHDTTYAVISHTHAIANVTGLQTALDGKAASSHNHDGSYAAANILNSLISGDANNILNSAPKFWVGSQANYDAIAVKSDDTFYHITT